MQPRSWSVSRRGIEWDMFPWMQTHRLPVGPHTWEVSVADAAGHTVVASATFTVEDPASSGGPSLSELNITDGMILPDTAELWVQGRWSGADAKVFVSAGFGTNVVVVSAVDGTGRLAAQAVRVVRSGRYRVVRVWPGGDGAGGATGSG